MRFGERLAETMKELHHRRRQAFFTVRLHFIVLPRYALHGVLSEPRTTSIRITTRISRRPHPPFWTPMTAIPGSNGSWSMYRGSPAEINCRLSKAGAT